MQIYLSHLFAPSSSAHLCKEVNFAQWELSVKFSSVTFRCFMASSLSSSAQVSQI